MEIMVKILRSAYLPFFLKSRCASLKVTEWCFIAGGQVYSYCSPGSRILKDRMLQSKQESHFCNRHKPETNPTGFPVPLLMQPYSPIRNDTGSICSKPGVPQDTWARCCPFPTHSSSSLDPQSCSLSQSAGLVCWYNKRLIAFLV